MIAVVQFGLAMMPLCCFDVARVDFRNHERDGIVHAEGAGIIDDHAAGFRGDRREFLGDAAAGAEQRDVDALECIFGQFLDRDLLPLNFSFLPTERAEASNVSLPNGKLRFSSVLIISMPTAPVAPTTATCGLRFIKASEYSQLQGAVKPLDRAA